MNHPFNLSRRLKELRGPSGLTQEQIAAKADLDYKFYQSIESGRQSMVRLFTIEKLCKAYDIELWEFFYTQRPQTKLDRK